MLALVACLIVTEVTWSYFKYTKPEKEVQKGCVYVSEFSKNPYYNQEQDTIIIVDTHEKYCQYYSVKWKEYKSDQKHWIPKMYILIGKVDTTSNVFKNRPK